MAPWYEADMANEKPATMPSVDDQLAVAGKEFAEAVKNGDGLRVAKAYKALKTICEMESEAEAVPGESGEAEQY